jgi:HlyD family secretion protein
MTSSETGAKSASSTGIFRSAAVERVSSPERLDMAAAIIRPTAWMLMFAIGVLAMTALVASILIKVPIKVSAPGLLLNAGGIKDAIATGGGQIKAIRVHPGVKVKAGDVIAELDEPDLRQQIDTGAAELSQLRNRRQRLGDLEDKAMVAQQQAKAQQREALVSAIFYARQHLDLLTERLHTVQDAVARGALAKQKIIDARLEVGQATEGLSKQQAALRQLDGQDAARGSDEDRERLDLDARVAESQRNLDQLRDKLAREQTVTSPASGIVAELKASEGDVVERGASLASIIPDAGSATEAGKPSLVAILFVPAVNGKKIKPGMQAEILPATARREETGFVVGTVTYVSDIPATQESMQREIRNRQLVQGLSAQGAPFEVRAEMALDPTTPSGLKWSTSQGLDAPLSDGTPIEADFVTRTEPVLQLLIPAVKPLFDLVGHR